MTLLVALVLAAPPVVRERTYTWVDKSIDLKLVEVEKLTFRAGKDGKPVRERILLRSEMDGAKVPGSATAQPEVLAAGEVSEDPLTARIDRITGVTAPAKSAEWQKSFEKAPPLPSAGLGFRVLLAGPEKTIASLAYGEDTGMELKGRASFGKGGALLFLAAKGTGINLPGSQATADLTVTEGPEGKSNPLLAGL